MNPGEFRLTDRAGAEQLSRILRAGIERAQREQQASRRPRGGQHAPSRESEVSTLEALAFWGDK